MTRGLGRVGLVVEQGFLTARARLALWTNSTAHQDIQGRINASPRPCLWTKIQISWKKPRNFKKRFPFFKFYKHITLFFQTWWSCKRIFSFFPFVKIFSLFQAWKKCLSSFDFFWTYIYKFSNKIGFFSNFTKKIIPAELRNLCLEILFFFKNCQFDFLNL